MKVHITKHAIYRFKERVLMDTSVSNGTAVFVINKGMKKYPASLRNGVFPLYGHRAVVCDKRLVTVKP